MSEHQRLPVELKAPLVNATAASRKQMLGELVDGMRPQFESYASNWGLTKNNEVGDIISLLWIELDKNQAFPDGIQNPEGFVFGIFKNLCKASSRRLKRAGTVSIDNILIEFKWDGKQPLEMLISDEEQRKLHQAMAGLAKTDRLLLELRGIGLTNAEISRASGIPLGSVGYKLRDSISRLLQLLKQSKDK